MTGLCEHKIWRDACRACDGRRLCKNLACSNLVAAPGAACTTCAPEPSRKAESGEARMAHTLSEWYRAGALPMAYTTWGKTNPVADRIQNGSFRPDFYFDVAAEGRVVLLEYDERAHQSYIASCEFGRQGRLAVGYHTRSVHIIRYNPDNISELPWSKGLSTKYREECLLQRLQAALSSQDNDDNELTVEYLFYPMLPSMNTEPQQPQQQWLQRFTFRMIQPDYEAWAAYAGDVCDMARQYVTRASSSKRVSAPAPAAAATMPSIAPFLSALVHGARSTSMEELAVQRKTLYAQYLSFEKYEDTSSFNEWARQLEAYASSIQKAGNDTYRINVLGLHYQLVDAGDYVAPQPTEKPAIDFNASVTTGPPPHLDRFLSSLANDRFGECVVKISGMALFNKYMKYKPEWTTATITAFGRAMRSYALSATKRNVRLGVEYVIDKERLRQELIRRKTYDADAEPIVCDDEDEDDDAPPRKKQRAAPSAGKRTTTAAAAPYRSCDGYYLCEGGCRALVPAYGQRCLACPPSPAPVAPVREDGYSSVCT